MISRHADRKAGAHATQGTHGAVQTSLEYLDSRFTENVTLSELSRTTGLSEFHLVRLFREKVGLPPPTPISSRNASTMPGSFSPQACPLPRSAWTPVLPIKVILPGHSRGSSGSHPAAYRRTSKSVQDKADRFRLQ